MKYLLMAVLAFGAAGAAAAYEDDGLSEEAVTTDTAKSGDEDEEQPLIQENDEDLAAFVTDYVRKDIQLKGAFLIESKAEKKILKLDLVSVEKTAENEDGGEKKVSVVFKDASGKKFTAYFHLQNGPWGGLDIFKIELKGEKARAAEHKKK